jgi:hypothetical protein
MNSDRVIPGQVVRPDSNNGGPTEAQETFLHKVASRPLASSDAGVVGRHYRTDETDDSYGAEEAEVSDFTNADDDTEVIAETSAMIVPDLDVDDAGTSEADHAPAAGTTAEAEVADTEVVEAEVVDDEVVDDEDEVSEDGGSAVAAATEVTEVTETRTSTPAAAQAPGGQRANGDEPLLGEDAGRIREEWRQVQGSFVDDPLASLTSAAGVVADATARLESVLRERQRTLRDTWEGNGQADTETLRQLMLVYRRLLNKLIS